MKANKNNKDIRQQTSGNRQQIKNYKIRIINLFWSLCLWSFVFCLLSGCNSENEIKQLKSQINTLNEEKVQLTKRIDQTNAENEQLKSRISTLQNLPENVKGENLYQLENIKIHNYSTLYDENKDGKPDTLIVRIQPVDNYGDLIKASGSVEVELWNLNNSQEKAKIGTWQVNPQELKKIWNDTLVTNYRLSFDITDKIEKFDEPLNLKIVFIDYLSGKTFHEQKILEP
jgi:cell division protein FtsB